MDKEVFQEKRKEFIIQSILWNKVYRTMRALFQNSRRTLMKLFANIKRDCSKPRKEVRFEFEDIKAK